MAVAPPPDKGEAGRGFSIGNGTFNRLINTILSNPTLTLPLPGDGMVFRPENGHCRLSETGKNRIILDPA